MTTCWPSAGWSIFPEFIWDAENERWDPSQHMFTMPLPEDLHLLDTDPGAARGSQYDMMLQRPRSRRRQHTHS